MKVPVDYLQDYKEAFGSSCEYISAWNPSESGDDTKPVTPCAPILISASSSTSSISYLPEMTCGTRCRLSSQNIPKLTSAHWASHQATGRKNHCGAHDDEDRDCRKKEKICHITNPSPLHHLTLYLYIYRQ